MTHQELQAMRAHLKAQLALTGQLKLVAGDKKSTHRWSGAKDPAPIILGLPEIISDQLYKHLYDVRARINAHRVEARKLQLTPAKVRANKTIARAAKVFRSFRPSATPSISCSPNLFDWKATGHGPEAQITVSPAWGFSTFPLHKALVLPYFILYSCRVGKPLADGSEIHRIRTARYVSGDLREDRDAPPYMAVNLAVACHGRGETLLKARMALFAMMAKQVRTRLRG